MDFRTFLKSKMALLTSDHGNRYTATGKFMTVPVLNVSPGRQLWHWAGRCELTVPQPPATRPGPARAVPCCPPRCVGPARAAVSALLPSLLCPPLLCASRAARCPLPTGVHCAKSAAVSQRSYPLTVALAVQHRIAIFYTLCVHPWTVFEPWKALFFSAIPYCIHGLIYYGCSQVRTHLFLLPPTPLSSNFPPTQPRTARMRCCIGDSSARSPATFHRVLTVRLSVAAQVSHLNVRRPAISNISPGNLLIFLISCRLIAALWVVFSGGSRGLHLRDGAEGQGVGCAPDTGVDSHSGNQILSPPAK